MSNLTASLLAIIMSVPSAPLAMSQEMSLANPVPYELSLSQWAPRTGDKILVDTLNNEAYLMHEDGSYLNFTVVTGQRRWVYYIGRSYNASTPNWHWVAKSLHIKGDRVTFGPTGRFLRLYKDGETNTAYGFHEYRTDEEMFEDEDGNLLPASERFRSMGCVIVTTAMMDLVVETWEQNGQVLEVVTQHGISDLRAAMMAFEQEDTENL